MSNTYFDNNVFNKGKAFIPFLTAGYPTLDATEKLILKMEEAGADLIEVGIPFSDPIAEGPVIQKSSQLALKNGVNVEHIFEMLKRIREKSNLPMVFMAYANSLFVYGLDKFFQKCQELEIKGVILPDVPFEEKEEFEEVAKKYDVEIISFIAPTSSDRIKMIAQASRGFIYVVSSLGVTGVREEITTDLGAINEVIRQTTITKTAIGFGINNPIQAKEIAKHSDGVIVGSAIIKLIEKSGDNYLDAVYNYVKEMKEAINS